MTDTIHYEKPKFIPLKVVATRAVATTLEHGTLAKLYHRHTRGDWGECDEEDSRRNDEALEHGGRVLSSFSVEGVEGESRVYVITEHDRSVCTILFPSEY